MMLDEYTIRCREKGEPESTSNLDFFDNQKFSDLSRATEWAAMAAEAIKRSRSDYPVRNPVIEVVWKVSGRAKVRFEVTPTGEVIKTQLVL
jgi:hypothetical protein